MQLQLHVDSKLEHRVSRFTLYLPSSKTPPYVKTADFS